MATRTLRNNKGVTILEVVITTTLLGMVMVCTLGLFTSMLGAWAKGASGNNANSYAGIAMRKLVLDMEEGMTASTNADGTQLTVTFPYRASTTSDYNRGKTGLVITYFLSGSTGSESTGTYLWKSVNSVKTRMARNVEIKSLLFSVTNGKLVRINLVGYDREGGAYTPNLIQQSVKLRNG